MAANSDAWKQVGVSRDRWKPELRAVNEVGLVLDDDERVGLDQAVPE